MAGLRKFLKPIVPSFIKKELRRNFSEPGDWRGVVDLRKVTEDPIEAIYISHRASPVIDVPLQRCRGLQAVGVSFNATDHPFVAAATCLAQGLGEEMARRRLVEYYQRFQPLNALDAMGLATEHERSELEGLPAAAVLLPWWIDMGGISLDARRTGWKDALKSDYKQAGFEMPADVAAPNWFGPQPKSALNIEIARLTKLVKSFEMRGLERSNASDGDITGVVLERENRDWCVTLHSGQHRAAVAAATGIERIAVRLFPTVSAVLVRRDDVNRWPHVRSGLFSLDQALSVFDRIFSGVPPSKNF